MMEKLKWIGEKKMKVVRELDLMTYFQNYEPDELIRKGYNDYITNIVLYIYLMVYGVIFQEAKVDVLHMII